MNAMIGGTTCNRLDLDTFAMAIQFMIVLIVIYNL
jgi:hypothetical protein